MRIKTLWMGILSGLLLVGWTLDNAQAQYFSPWKMSKHSKIIPFSSPSPGHGDISEFAYAPPIPTWPSSAWKDAPHPRDINYSVGSRHCGRANDCLRGGDFMFYRTELRFPAGYKLTSLKLRYWAVDDGVQLKIFNSKYPQGVIPKGSHVGYKEMRRSGPQAGSAETSDISSYIQVNEVNVIVLIHVDDCCAAMVMQRVEILANQKTLLHNEEPVLESIPSPYAVPQQTYKYIVQIKDSDTLVYKIFQKPSTSTFDLSSKLFTWVPTLQDLGKTVTFHIRACDPHSACVDHKWTVRVSDVSPNHSPTIISSPTWIIRFDQTYTYQVKARDEDAWDQGALVYRMVQAPQGLTIDAQTGRIEWSPQDTDAKRSHACVVEVCDVEGSCVEQSWEVYVRSIRKPVISTTPTVRTFVGAHYTYRPHLWESEQGAVYTWKLIQGPNLYFTPKTGKITWMVRSQDAGKTVPFAIQVCTAIGTCTRQKWFVQVSSTRHSFTISSSPELYATVKRKYTYTFSTAPKTTRLQFTLLQAPTGCSVQKETLHWTPSTSSSGKSVTFSVRVCDLEKKCRTQTWTVEVLPENRTPFFTSMPIRTAQEKTLYTYSVRTSDADRWDTFRWYTFVTAPKGAKMGVETGDIQWEPPIGSSKKPHPFVVKCCDLRGQCQTQKWNVGVAPFPFRIVSLPKTDGKEDEPYIYPAQARRINGQIVAGKWSILRGANTATISAQGTLSWVPNAQDIGRSVPFTLQVCKSQIGCVQQSWKVRIRAKEAQQPPPVFDSTPSTTATVYFRYEYDVVVRVSKGNAPLALSFEEKPKGAFILQDVNNGHTVHWKPTLEHSKKTVRFTLRACDKKKQCTRQKWTVSVHPPLQGNSRPQFTLKTLKVADECKTQQDCGFHTPCINGQCARNATPRTTVTTTKGGKQHKPDPTPPQVGAVACACSSGTRTPSIPGALLLLFFWCIGCVRSKSHTRLK